MKKYNSLKIILGKGLLNPDDAHLLEQVWVTVIRNRGLRTNITFIFKEWGIANKIKARRALEGRTWDEMPRGMQVARV